MNNFYGKRFLSALMGALSVLSSPVASAVGGKLGKGNLKGKVGPSSGRSKNGGKGGKLEVNREVKSVNGLKKVLKETGGKVVRVSPDGKGGFVAFIEIPRGIVTVAIVSVPLAVIIYCLVCFGRKNGEGIGGSEKVSGGLLDKLFSGIQGRYDFFVKKLFKSFFGGSDNSDWISQKFHSCGEDLDKFLESVFKVSCFDGNNGSWRVGRGEYENSAWLSLGTSSQFVKPFMGDSSEFGNLVVKLFGYLRLEGLVKIPECAEQANWGDKISVMLFAVWCSVGFESAVKDFMELREVLACRGPRILRKVFDAISNYVRDRLEAAGRDYNGQKKKLMDNDDE